MSRLLRLRTGFRKRAALEAPWPLMAPALTPAGLHGKVRAGNLPVEVGTQGPTDDVVATLERCKRIQTRPTTTPQPVRALTVNVRGKLELRQAETEEQLDPGGWPTTLINSSRMAITRALRTRRPRVKQRREMEQKRSCYNNKMSWIVTKKELVKELTALILKKRKG